MKSLTQAVLLSLFVTLACAGAAAAQAKNPLADLIAGCGLETTKLGDEAWNIPFDVGKDKPVEVIVAYHDEDRQFALIYTTVVDRADNFEFNQKVLQECMKLNGSYPVAKFTLDAPAGNLDCEIQAHLPTLTPETLKLYASFVASIADENKANLEQLAGQ